MYKTTLATILGLNRYKVIKCLESPGKVTLHVKPRRKTANCTKCGKRSKHVHEYRLPQTIKHISIGIKQSHLVVYKRRFYCRVCNKPFTEKIPKW